MSSSHLYQRFAETALAEALADSPVVLIHGPRQCGKSTLARMLGDKQGYVYTSFDDDVMCEAAEADPVGFVDDLPEHAIKDLFIEGDNLDTLKLLQETYLNKVKMIYIDPPYNYKSGFHLWRRFFPEKGTIFPRHC